MPTNPADAGKVGSQKSNHDVFLDNARYHHAKILQPWLNNPERLIKLHFLPPYAPHLNPIERLRGVMHKWVTHNRHYATFDQFTEAILGFFRKTLPDKWREFTDTVVIPPSPTTFGPSHWTNIK
jgi:transposase